MKRLSFSGHETFYCRHFWLKKGVDFVEQGRSFTAKDAVMHLGVGKNMVSAIRFWMRAFGLLKLDKVTKNEYLSHFAKLLFAENGFDPYLEDTASLWLLHYHLVKTAKASIYPLVFNDFRKERIEFTREQLLNFLKRVHIERHGSTPNENTVKKDVGVFLRNYLRPATSSKKHIEDDFSALLMDLNLVKNVERVGEKSKWYRIESAERKDLPVEVLLFSILDNPIHTDSTSVSFTSLLNDANSIGSIFVLSPNELVTKIEDMTRKFDFLVYSDTAGVRELQFKSKPDKWAVLKSYYAV